MGSGSRSEPFPFYSVSVLSALSVVSYPERNRSASIAAMQPVPAAVTAWR
jgi:hypothetical protein